MASAAMKKWFSPAHSFLFLLLMASSIEGRRNYPITATIFGGIFGDDNDKKKSQNGKLPPPPPPPEGGIPDQQQQQQQRQPPVPGAPNNPFQRRGPFQPPPPPLPNKTNNQNPELTPEQEEDGSDEVPPQPPARDTATIRKAEFKPPPPQMYPPFQQFWGAPDARMQQPPPPWMPPPDSEHNPEVSGAAFTPTFAEFVDQQTRVDEEHAQYIQHLLQDIEESSARERALLEKVENLTKAEKALEQREELHVRQLDVLTERVMEVEAQAASERNALLEYQANCTEMGRTIAEQKDELEEWKLKCSELTEQLEQEQSRSSDIRLLLDERTSELENMAMAIEEARLDDEIDALKAALKEKKKKKKKGFVGWIISMLVGTGEDEEEKLEAVQELAKNTLLRALQNERDSVEELETQLTALEGKNFAISEMIQSRDEVIEELNDRISVFEEDKVVLKAALKQLQKEMKEEAPKTQKIVNDLAATRKEVARLHEEMEKLIEENEERVYELEEQLEAKQAVINATEANMAVIGNYVDQLEERLGSFAVARQNIDVREAKCKEIEQSAIQTKEERDALQQQLAEAQRESSDMKQLLEELVEERASLQQERQNLINELSSKSAERDHLENRNNELEMKIQNLDVVAREWELKANALEAELTSSLNASSESSYEIDSLKAAYEELQNELKAAVVANADLRYDLDSMTEASADLAEALHLTRRELNALKEAATFEVQDTPKKDSETYELEGNEDFEVEEEPADLDFSLDSDPSLSLPESEDESETAEDNQDDVGMDDASSNGLDSGNAKNASAESAQAQETLTGSSHEQDVLDGEESLAEPENEEESDDNQTDDSETEYWSAAEEVDDLPEAEDAQLSGSDAPEKSYPLQEEPAAESEDTPDVTKEDEATFVEVEREASISQQEALPSVSEEAAAPAEILKDEQDMPIPRKETSAVEDLDKERVSDSSSTLQVEKKAPELDENSAGGARELQPPSSSVRFRKVRKEFAKATGLHGFFSSTRRKRKEPEPPQRPQSQAPKRPPPPPKATEEAKSALTPRNSEKSAVTPVSSDDQRLSERLVKPDHPLLARATEPVIPAVRHPPKPQTKDVPFRTIRKKFAKVTGMHGAFTPSKRRKAGNGPLQPKQQRGPPPQPGPGRPPLVPRPPPKVSPLPPGASQASHVRSNTHQGPGQWPATSKDPRQPSADGGNGGKPHQ